MSALDSDVGRVARQYRTVQVVVEWAAHLHFDASLSCLSPPAVVRAEIVRAGGAALPKLCTADDITVSFGGREITGTLEKANVEAGAILRITIDTDQIEARSIEARRVEARRIETRRVEAELEARRIEARRAEAQRNRDYWQRRHDEREAQRRHDEMSAPLDYGC